MCRVRSRVHGGVLPSSGVGSRAGESPRGNKFRVGWLNAFGRGTTREGDAQGTPAQTYISPSILVYEDKPQNVVSFLPLASGVVPGSPLTVNTPCP